MWSLLNIHCCLCMSPSLSVSSPVAPRFAIDGRRIEDAHSPVGYGHAVRDVDGKGLLAKAKGDERISWLNVPSQPTVYVLELHPVPALHPLLHLV